MAALETVGFRHEEEYSSRQRWDWIRVVMVLIRGSYALLQRYEFIALKVTDGLLKCGPQQVPECSAHVLLHALNGAIHC